MKQDHNEKIGFLEKRIKELETLYEVSAYELSAALNENVNLEEVTDLTLDTVMKLTGAERGCLMLWDKEAEELYIKAERTPDGHPFGLRRMKSGEGIGGWAFQNGQIFVVNDVDKEPRFIKSPSDQLEIKSIISVPLVVEDRKIGVINLGTIDAYHHFTDDEIKTLRLIASRAALVIENVNLRQNEKKYIRELKNSSEEMKKQSDQLNAIVDNMADGVLTFDRNNKITAFNRAAEKITGINSKEAIGKSIASVLLMRDEEGNGFVIRETSIEELSSDALMKWEGFLTIPDGTERFISAIPTPLAGSGGIEEGIVVFRDLTREKEVEQLKSDFVSYVSHELRSPLTSIKGYTTVLLHHGDQFCREKKIEFLQIINDEIDRLVRLIKNLLDLAKIESGKFEVSKEETDLPVLAERVINIHRIFSSDHYFEIDFPQNFPPVYADSDQIEQALSNLVSNAIKYSPGGGKIRIIGKSETDKVMVCIEDEGPGIPVEHAGKIFEKFYRIGNKGKTTVVGTGLGLFITKNIINAHGGEIWAENKEEGKGSRFYLSLPNA